MVGPGQEVKLELTSETKLGNTPTDDQIREAMREALADVDLSQTTERQLRKQLEEKFGVDLSDRKAIIRSEVEDFLASQEPIEEEEEEVLHEDFDDAPVKKRAGGGGGSALSPEMQEFLGVTTCARPQVVKRIWDYIKANNLQDPNDKRSIILDEKLATLFNPPINMFSMNKQLSRHVKSIEGGSSGGVGEKAPRKRKSTSKSNGPRRKSAKHDDDDDDGDKPKRGGGGFTKLCKITPELADWLGGDAAASQTYSRTALTKFFWDYVRTNGLQNPDNKKEILCDDRLQDLTGCDRFTGFGFMKHFNPHFVKE